MPTSGVDDRLATYLAAALIVSGAVKSFFLGLILPRLIQQPPWAADPTGMAINGVTHGAVILGWLWLVLSGKNWFAVGSGRASPSSELR